MRRTPAIARIEPARLGPMERIVTVKGETYRVQLARFPPGPGSVWDVMLRRTFHVGPGVVRSMAARQRLRAKYGRTDTYAASRRPWP